MYKRHSGSVCSGFGFFTSLRFVQNDRGGALRSATVLIVKRQLSDLVARVCDV